MGPGLTLALQWWLACSGGDERLRSSPTPPTVDLSKRAPPAIVWSDLTELVPATPCALPARVAELVPGTGGARTREVMDAAHLAGTRFFADVLADKLVMTIVLDGHPDVTVHALLDAEGRALEEVQVSVPHDPALPLLTTRWGEADAAEFVPEGRTIYRWTEPGAPWAVELQATEDLERALIRWHRPAAG